MKQATVKILGALFIALFGLNAQAVVITETYDPVTDTGDFVVTNDSTLGNIVAFAVANNTGFGVDGQTESGHGLWTAGLASASIWDFGTDNLTTPGIFKLTMAATFGAGTTQAFIYWVTPDPLATDDPLADYVELGWALTDSGTNLFEGDSSALGIAPSDTGEPFGFSATSAGSPCVALLSNGSTEACVTVPAAVPVPGAAVLFLSALAGLFGFVRRRG